MRKAKLKVRKTSGANYARTDEDRWRGTKPGQVMKGRRLPGGRKRAEKIAKGLSLPHDGLPLMRAVRKRARPAFLDRNDFNGGNEMKDRNEVNDFNEGNDPNEGNDRRSPSTANLPPSPPSSSPSSSPSQNNRQRKRPVLADRHRELDRDGVPIIAPAYSANQRQLKNKRKMAKALVKHGGSVSKACREAKITRMTHYRWMESDPSYAAFVEELKLAKVDDVEEVFMDTMVKTKDMRSMRWFLERQGQDRGYGKPSVANAQNVTQNNQQNNVLVMFKDEVPINSIFQALSDAMKRNGGQLVMDASSLPSSASSPSESPAPRCLPRNDDYVEAEYGDDDDDDDGDEEFED